MAKGLKILALGGLAALIGYAVTRPAKARGMVDLPGAKVIPTQLPPELLALTPVVVNVVSTEKPAGVVTQPLQPTMVVSEPTPIVATTEIYTVLAGRELTDAELAVAPVLVQLPNGAIATYIPPLVSPTVLAIKDAHAIVTGPGDLYKAERAIAYLADIIVTIIADRDYQNMSVWLVGAPLVFIPEEEFHNGIPTGGAKLVDIPQGESTYVFKTYWPIYDSQYVATWLRDFDAYSSVEVGISQLGQGLAILQRQKFDLRAELKSGIESLLGATLTL